MGSPRKSKVKMTLVEIDERMEAVRSELKSLAELDGEGEIRRSQSRWNALEAEYEELSAERAGLLERAKKIAELGGSAMVSMSGDGATTIERFNVNHSTLADPWSYQRDGIDASRLTDLEDRAEAAVARAAFARDEARQAATEILERAQADASLDDNGLMSRWALATSSEEYYSAFAKVTRSPMGFMEMDAAERAAWTEGQTVQRALNEGAVAQGQALVPIVLDSSIHLTNNGTINPFPVISTVKTIATQSWKGVTSAGVTAEWTAEAAEAADATPTDLANPTITPVRGDAYVEATFEVAMDTDIASQLSQLFTDARDRLESTAFAVGTGSTQPYGVVTELGLVTASRVSAQTNGSYGSIDVYNMDDSLGNTRWSNTCVWVANKAIYNRTRRFAESSGPQHAFWTDFEGNMPSKLIGHNTYVSSAMQGTLSAATASSDDVLLLGDFREGFYIVRRVGMQVSVVNNVIGANRRPIGAMGWFCYWRTGSRVVLPQALRMLRV